MSCSVLSDGTVSCFYCDTTMVAFGPIMDSEEQADEFHNWIIGEKGFTDPRKVPLSDLINTLWPEFYEKVWPDRLCKECDMYDEMTTDGKCFDCKENTV